MGSRFLNFCLVRSCFMCSCLVHSCVMRFYLVCSGFMHTSLVGSMFVCGRFSYVVRICLWVFAFYALSLLMSSCLVYFRFVCELLACML